MLAILQAIKASIELYEQTGNRADVIVVSPSTHEILLEETRKYGLMFETTVNDGLSFYGFEATMLFGLPIVVEDMPYSAIEIRTQ